ncbi:MAG: DNA polymerase III subunit alpha, partial [Pseudomonadota bacterium]
MPSTASTLAARPFVHFHAHSAYSLLEGALSIGDLARLCQEDGMPAVSVADTNNLFGALEFSEKMTAAGVQPIVGAQLCLSAEEIGVAARKGRAGPSIVLVAQNAEGYAGLMRIASRAFLAPASEMGPSIALSEIEAAGEGLLCLTGGPDGPLDRLLEDGRDDDAFALGARLASVFGDRLYVELQRHGLADERRREPGLVDIAYRQGLPLIATNEPYFAGPEMFEAHDALLCIAEGAYVSEVERRRLTPEHWFKPAQAMTALFADLPEAIDNAFEAAQRCAVRPRQHPPILPRFTANDDAHNADDGAAAEAEELARQAREGLKSRLEKHPLADKEEAYWARLDRELGIINKMGFPGYFLIVSDFIKWAKTHEVPVGPGRGSGAGSLVAWSLTITDLDPLRFGLLFERFLNPERVSMPDFDIDFCQDRRDEVIGYVQERYGADRVAQIITFGKLQARAVLRDVGRVLSMPYGQVDALCKMVPNNPANPVTLAEAIDSEARLQEERDDKPEVADLLDKSLKLEGLYRHASTHAAGVVIGDRPLEELVPLYRDPRSEMPATQFNMKWVEPAGLVKFDFLGLKTLTVLQRAVEFLRERGVEIDLAALPLDDAPTFKMLGEGASTGVFQLESAGMRAVLKSMKPDSLEDIIALVSLYRPGPMENIPTYIACKSGEQEPDYLHPLLEPVLKETYGVIIYQEQVMQIAQILSGYSLGEADLLRRAMGKKQKAEMDKQKVRFLDGAKENGVDAAKADGIFELVAKFAGYGFNKSHAAAYAFIAYQTAYLKANYPAEFLAASMALDQTNTDKLSLFVDEARRIDVAVRSPDLTRSAAGFSVQDGEILYALGAVKNVGEQAMAEIVHEREEGGAFADLFDFARRIDPRHMNKKAFENLARAGAFDRFGVPRAQVAASADRLVAFSQASAEERRSAQVNLFGEAGEEMEPPRLADVEEWTPLERLDEERGALGFYFSGHPLDDFKGALEEMGVLSVSELRARAEGGRAA